MQALQLWHVLQEARAYTCMCFKAFRLELSCTIHRVHAPASQVTILQWVPPVQQLHYLHRFESSISAFGSSQFVRRHAMP